MTNLKINQDRCTQCGQCAKECPVLIIKLKPFPVIAPESESACLACQHCLAVCPEEALSIFGVDPAQSVKVDPTKNPSMESMEQLIKTRRSVRRFKRKSVEKKLIHRLLDTASYAPTGKNTNTVLFTVIDNHSEFEAFRVRAYEIIEKAFADGTVPAEYAFVENFVRMWKSRGVDVVFRSAPHHVIASAHKDAVSASVDGFIALSYFELLSNSEGISTLWNGFLSYLFSIAPQEMRQLINLPEDHRFVYAMSFGYPAVKYHRAVQQQGNHIAVVKMNAE